jgi:hypothetical protein
LPRSPRSSRWCSRRCVRWCSTNSNSRVVRLPTGSSDVRLGCCRPTTNSATWPSGVPSWTPLAIAGLPQSRKLSSFDASLSGCVVSFWVHRRAHPRGVAWYSVGVSTAGLLVGVWWTVTDGVRAADTIDGRVLLLCGLSVLHNSWTHPILNRVGKIDRGGGSLFDYALLLGWAAGVSVPAIMVAILLSHAIRHWHDRPTLGKALFNAGQFALAATAAVWVLQELSAIQSTGLGQPVAVVGGMVAYSMVNTVLMRIAIALDRTSANLQALWSGWPMDVAEWILLAGLASASVLAVHSLLGIRLLWSSRLSMALPSLEWTTSSAPYSSAAVVAADRPARAGVAREAHIPWPRPGHYPRYSGWLRSAKPRSPSPPSSAVSPPWFLANVTTTRRSRSRSSGVMWQGQDSNLCRQCRRFYRSHRRLLADPVPSLPGPDHRS